MSTVEATFSAMTDHVKEFLLQFKDQEGSYKYVDAIDNMLPSNTTYVVIDYNDLVMESDIESKFADKPDQILDAFGRAVKEILQQKFPQYAEKIKHEIRVRIANYPVQRSLRQINAEVIGKLTSVSGMVLRASEVKPLAKELIYVCPDGHKSERIVFEKDLEVKPPIQCDNPKCNHKDLDIEPESSRFIDVQFVRLQELPEDLPPGQLPHYLDVTVKQDLVDYARPGDRVVLTGIVRIEPERITGIPRKTNPVYRLRLSGNNVEFLGGKGSTASRRIDREEISPEEEKTIKSLSQSSDIYERLIGSFAPHITGQDLIKEAVLLLMVGSTQRELADGAKIRGDINIFLVGDPGTAKSEILKFTSRVAPRGLYTSGRGSTAAGLTAAVVRDNNGIFMLEAGATVLGDQGIVSIDEFDKMKPEDRSALHEVMEQQTASIAKGGIVATLNARCSILAAANPMYGKYDKFKNITENVNLPVPLLTRFDLIFVVKDTPSKEKDSMIAKHIINLHTTDGIDSRSLIEPEILTKYLSYCKRINPALSKEAEQKFHDYYLNMRNLGKDSEDMITVTPRQLEGLIRIGTARARLLLKDKVESEDAERAIFLYEQMLENAGIDHKTGKIDIGILQGHSSREVSKLQAFMDTLKILEGEPKQAVDEGSFVDELVKTGKFKGKNPEDEAKNYIRKMIQEASIVETQPGKYNTI